MMTINGVIILSIRAIERRPPMTTNQVKKARVILMGRIAGKRKIEQFPTTVVQLLRTTVVTATGKNYD